MFITDYGYTVIQSEFCDLVKKYQSEEDISYYISISDPLFFEPSTNIEVLTLQNIVWCKSKILETNETAFQLYIDWKKIQSDSIKLFLVELETFNISEQYKNFVILGSKARTTKHKIKKMLRNLNLNPDFGLFKSNIFITINRVYYSLRDLDIAMRFEIKKLKKIYEEHKKETMKQTNLCFNRNFGLSFNLQIDKKSFMSQIESFLFLN